MKVTLSAAPILEAPAGEVRLRSAPVYGFDADTGAGVDRVNGILRGVSAIQQVDALGHGMTCDEVTLQQVSDAINTAPGGIKVRFTHPGMCEDGTGKLLGKGTNARVAGGKVLFDVKLSAAAKTSPQGNLYQHVLDLATETPTDVGFSIAAEGRPFWKMADGTEQAMRFDDDGPLPAPKGAVAGLPRFRLQKLRAVDLVDEPAANRDGLFSDTSSSLGEEAFHAIDRYLQLNGLTAERAHSFAQRYFAARGIKSTTTTAGDSRPASQERDRMEKTALKALKAAHPDHAGLIVDLFADGKSEAEIVAAITNANSASLKARHDELVIKLAEAKTAHAAELAAKDQALATAAAALTALQAKHDALAALKAGAGKDPGASPESTENKTLPANADDVALKQRWDKSAKLRAEFGGMFDLFTAFVKDPGNKDRELPE